MKLFLKLTDNVIKQNLRQQVLFTFLYRLVAGIFYVKTVNGILRFSQHMAGYSYLTMSNMGAFLWRPFTISCVAAAIAVGLQVGFVRHVEARLVAQVVEQVVLGIVAGAHGVEV